MSSSKHEQIEGVRREASPPLPLWRHRDYLLLWGGQVVSVTGSQVSQLAFPLLILALTHSPAQAGIAAALRTIPYLVLSLPAGALVDRWNRKQVMIICDLERFLVVTIKGGLILRMTIENCELNHTNAPVFPSS